MTSKKRKTYTCEECTQPFTRKDRLETHIQNNHLPFNCKFCSLSVKGLNELKKHVKQHHEKESYTCEECAQPFTRKDRLENHMENKHQDMVCEFCGLIVKGKGELQKHVKQQHKKEEKILTRVEHSQTEDPPRSSEESDSDENTSEESAFNKKLRQNIENKNEERSSYPFKRLQRAHETLHNFKANKISDQMLYCHLYNICEEG